MESKLKSCLLLISLYIFPVFISAQVSQEWVVRYNGPGNEIDNACSIAVDPLGNVYVTGTSSESNHIDDYATIKYNSSGVQQWIQRYNGPGNYYDQAKDIEVDSSGNVYVTGMSYGMGTNEDYATIKYNSSGIQQWVQRYDGSINASESPRSMAVDASGNVYVTGGSWGNGTSMDYATIKYNSSGIQQWEQRYNGGDYDNASSVTVDMSGNVYVTGYSIGGLGSADCKTIKYNSSGIQQWVQIYNGPGNSTDHGNSIAVDASGNIYVSGSCQVSSQDYLTIKYNSSGVQQWVQIYNGPGNISDDASTIAVDILGNVYVTGASIGSGTISDYATIKYDASGVLQWVKRYNGPGNRYDNAKDIALDVSGNVYVTGESIGNGTSYDYVTIKYNSSGEQQWLQNYNGPANNGDNASSIVIDNSGNVYVTGASTGSGSNLDYATIKYSQSVGINSISSETPDDFKLKQNYPNPFNPSTKIQFDISKWSDVKVVIYDILGNEVETLIDKKLMPGTYEADFRGDKYSSGNYFCRLITSDFTETKKMTLIK